MAVFMYSMAALMGIMCISTEQAIYLLPQFVCIVAGMVITYCDIKDAME
jgi:hypothetical protein